ITGITGARLEINESLVDSIKRIRAITDKPLCIGFGVSNPEEAFRMSAIADGVIVGSAIVKILHESPERLEGFVRELRKAI
ncbi:MAG: tryptophan synthase subunit alpha, partial [Thermodesulfovibrionales bacterium]